jgi:uncharacterized protein YecT (DUF1311 family)
MKYFLILALALSSTVAFAGVKDDLAKIDKDLASCKKKFGASGDRGIIDCYDGALTKTNFVLDTLYNNIIAAINDVTNAKYAAVDRVQTVNHLNDAQSVWLNFRAAQSVFASDMDAGGQIGQSSALQTQYTMTVARILQLNPIVTK